MDNIIKIEASETEPLYYGKGLLKQQKLIAVKNFTSIEQNGKTIWKQQIDVCLPNGKLITSFSDGNYYVYLKLSKSFIVCYENFFVLMHRGVTKDNQIRDKYYAYTYLGRELDKAFYKWESSPQTIDAYNSTAKEIDQEKWY